MSEKLIIGRGVDTLLLNVYYMDADSKPDKRDLASFLVEKLNTWKNQAIAAEEPVVVPWAFQGVHLQMYPHGAGRGQWTWLLTSDLINVCLAWAAQLHRHGAAVFGIPVVVPVVARGYRAGATVPQSAF